MNAQLSLPLLMVVLAGVALAGLGLAYKMAGSGRCRTMAFSAVFLFFATLLAGGRACFEPTTWSDWRLWALGTGMGLLLYGVLALVVRVNRLGPASISWTLINLSILVPILLAPLLLDESFRLLDGAIVVLFVLMLLAMRRGLSLGHDPIQGSPQVFWLLLLLVFLMNGGFQFGSKLKDTFFQQRNAAGLATIFYGTGMVLALATQAIRQRSLRLTRRECGIGIFAGACSGLGNLLFLHGMSLPVMVAFPITQGIALIGGIALTAMLYREPVNASKIVGWLLGLALLALTVLRGT